MTEKEAARRWCPMGRGEQVTQVVMSVVVPCLGSGCMGWRWYKPNVLDGEKQSGYCGMAGRPVGTRR